MGLLVVLDGRWIRTGSGIGQYAYGLARSLPAAAPDVTLEVALPDTDDPLVRDLVERPDGYRPVRMRHTPESPAGVTELASRLLRASPAVYHAPDWLALPPLPGGWRTLATIHDLIPLVAPDQVPRSFKSRHPRLYRLALRSLARRASAIATDTRTWAEQISARLGIAPARIHVIPLGVATPRPVPPPEVDAVRERFGLGRGPYVLSVGRPEPYKGLVPLIRAFEAALEEERLVIAGPLDVRYPEAVETIRALGLESRVCITGGIDAPVLDALYAGATAFATLSRHEGFGLPPLEAASRGVPVLAPRRTVFPEVLGDAALLVDPGDPGAVIDGLRRVCRDAALRARLATAGPLRTERYAWSECARRTAALYRLLASRSARPVVRAADSVPA